MNAPDKLTLEFLNPRDVEFFFNENGFLIFKLCGEKKGRVELKRCYPFSLPDEYICITTLENDEIGIIRNINELDEGSLEAAKKELYSRYYCPEITSITSLKEKMGHFYIDVMIAGKKRTITVRDITKSLRLIRGDTLLITDMDGNRYTCESYSSLDSKSHKLIDPYLY